MTTRGVTVLSALLLLTGLATAGPLATCQNVTGEIKGVASDGSALTLAVSMATPPGCQSGAEIVSVAVADPALKTRVKEISRGDRVRIDLRVEAAAPNPTPTASDFAWLTIAGGPPLPAVTLGALVGLLLFTFAFSRNIRGLLFIGQDNRYSNSKTQAALWFCVMVVVYVSAYYLRWRGGYTDHISIPQNLVLLSGMSALTAGAAQAITSQKQATAASQGLAQKQTAATPRFPGDLIEADNQSFDLGDYQMIVITLIAVATYLVTAVAFLSKLEQRVSVSLPDIDGAMAALFGIGQGAYLTKKAGSDISH